MESAEVDCVKVEVVPSGRCSVMVCVVLSEPLPPELPPEELLPEELLPLFGLL